MKRRIVVVALLGLAWSAALAASQEPVSGAKELFYDPVGASATRLSPDAPAKPSPAAGTAQPGRPPARRDGKNRRVVNLPATPEARSSQTALGLSYWIELASADGSSGTQVTERHVFRSGDRIRLHFRSNADGNIALIQLGSSGTSQVLFPDPANGLADGGLAADQDKILPNDSAWFRFDEKPGTERLVVLFARSRRELDSFPLRSNLDEQETKSLVQNVQHVKGSKDLFIETETKTSGEVGTYGVNVSGKPVVLEIVLEHR
jgi:hypothetical protein